MKNIPNQITHDQAVSMLSYEPETGILIWKKSPNKSIKPGTIAGCPDNGRGYARVRLFKKIYRSHRLAWFLMTGEWPDQQIDHINGIRSDNRWCNLRLVSDQENHLNQKKPSNNTSGSIGVYLFNGKWRARIGMRGKMINLGVFNDFERAKSVRKSAEAALGFHANHGRDHGWSVIPTLDGVTK